MPVPPIAKISLFPHVKKKDLRDCGLTHDKEKLGMRSCPPGDTEACIVLKQLLSTRRTAQIEGKRSIEMDAGHICGADAVNPKMPCQKERSWMQNSWECC